MFVSIAEMQAHFAALGKPDLEHRGNGQTIGFWRVPGGVLTYLRGPLGGWELKTEAGYPEEMLRHLAAVLAMPVREPQEQEAGEARG